MKNVKHVAAVCEACCEYYLARVLLPIAMKLIQFSQGLLNQADALLP